MRNQLHLLSWTIYRKLRDVGGIFAGQKLEDLAGDFPGGSFWALSPQNEEKQSYGKIRKKSGGSNLVTHAIAITNR